MALKLVVDKIEDVEEGLRSAYEERDGKFHLLVDGVEDVAPLKRNLEAARRSERAMKLEVEKWQKLGRTEEEIAALVQKAEDDKLKEAEQKGEWDKLKAQMNQKHADDLKKREDLTEAEKKRAEKYQRQLERHLVDAAATTAIAAAKGVPDLLLPIVKRFIKVEQDPDTEEYSTSIVDEKGGPRVNGKGDPLTLDELLAEMKTSEKLGRAFDGAGHAGSGAAPGGGGGGASRQTPAGVPKSYAEAKTPVEKAKFIAHQKSLETAGK